MKNTVAIYLLSILFFLMACENQTQQQKSNEETEKTIAPVKKTDNPEKELIEDYLKMNQVNPAHTPSGIYYQVEDEGHGKRIGQGSVVRFHATGYFLNNTRFYSSLDGEKVPLEAIIGERMVIPGLEEGLQLFSEGGKGKIIIPSALAYGAKGQGEMIPPNTVLVFSLEILSVE